MLVHILGSCDAGEHKRCAFLRERCVLDTREMELLIGRQMKAVIDDAHVYRTDGVRTLGDDYRVGFECPRR